MVTLFENIALHVTSRLSEIIYLLIVIFTNSLAFFGFSYIILFFSETFVLFCDLLNVCPWPKFSRKGVKAVMSTR